MDVMYGTTNIGMRPGRWEDGQTSCFEADLGFFLGYCQHANCYVRGYGDANAR